MATTVEHQQRYFERQLDSNVEFWRRFGARPDVTGRRVLDLGCGHGALSIELAETAREVLGVDLNEELVDFARENVAARYGHLQDRLRFEVVDVAELPADEQFDVIVSKDTFEHLDDMGAMCRTLFRLLKPGGQLWAGFSPLYWSPTGDHRRTGLPLGMHAVLPQRVVLRAASRHVKKPVRSLADLGLNGATPEQFRRHTREAGFRTVSIGYNRGDSSALRHLDRLRAIRPLEKYATVSVYAVLERP